MPKKPTPPQSLILAEKSVEAILAPQPRNFVLGATTYPIYPLPDRSLMVVADAMAEILTVFAGLASLRNVADAAISAISASNEEEGDEGDNGAGATVLKQLKAVDVLPALPAILRALIPNATKLIAASLRLDDEFVANEIPAAKKLEALKLILEAEDIPLLLKNALALVGMLLPKPAPVHVAQPDAAKK